MELVWIHAAVTRIVRLHKKNKHLEKRNLKKEMKAARLMYSRRNMKEEISKNSRKEVACYDVLFPLGMATSTSTYVEVTLI